MDDALLSNHHYQLVQTLVHQLPTRIPTYDLESNCISWQSLIVQHQEVFAIHLAPLLQKRLHLLG